MKNTSKWIDGIVQDLVDSEKKLKDTLLKVQVLAFKIKNEKLKNWVDSELNGYKDNNIPEYRIIPTPVSGNLVQNRGFGGFLTRNNTTLPIEYLKKETYKRVTRLEFSSKVSEIERMLAQDKSYHIDIPHYIYIEFNESLANGWEVDAAWQKISLNSLEGILSSIKSNLLTFLLELNQEIGDNEDYSIMVKEKNVDKLFEKTIGSISGKTVNVQIGDRSMKTVSKGEKSNLNISQGQDVNQEINIDIKNDVQELIQILNENLENFGLNNEDKEDVCNEINRLETQLDRSNPKFNIINTAIHTINGILTGITANAYTPLVLDKLQDILSKI
ncbi:hypothetical protein [Gillisia limnaea]|uniref:AbiTii domain-containing protein n=1 Tax=Gillisia limnaea (strain DSM 15749 / LMG 21470 / R-8282) TaxID=865937 RepID=H2BXI0_GILLR|nr:hypothetical protein [Gillisia limnaea]EHQ02062.1 hypothetical protein Gilli_1404 [Gillisia limnaea DSM 15749]